MRFIFIGLPAVLLSAFVFTAKSQTIKQEELVVRGGITTLYAVDPIGQSLCLQDGGFGSVIKDGQVFNRCSDLNFNSYVKGGFSVGVEGTRRGALIDLGSAEDLRKAYGYTETVGNGQGFASINLRNNRAVVLKDYGARTFQELGESEALFAAPTTVMASLPVKLGHIYLLRVTDPTDKEYERVAKLVVVAYVPDQSVTFRWERLR